ncbi:MAG: PAS domain-containing protein, partial [Cytophagales bacterium]|nr:PAS domain-containing protein [Cytophagales bacterium]
FKIESELLGVNYTMYNLFFLLGLASFISYFFVDGAQKVKQKLDEMKEREVMDLDTKYRYMTENVDEIISLHLAHGDSTYISPSLKIILGYESHELLGLRYFNLLGGNFIDKEISCLTKEGKEVWLEVTFAPIVDEIGSGEVYISMAKDISEKVWENQRISQLRKQIANDFHDEMGNKLASITLNSNILSLMVVENERQKNIIQKIESTSNALYQHSRDFIWSIDPKSDHLREIFSYLRDFGDDYFQNSEMNFRIDSLGFSEQENIVLPMYWGRHIVLIFKEIMAVIRTGASNRNIELALEVDESTIVISLRDDGKSVEDLERKKLALSGMGPRAEIIQGELKMESFSRGNKISLILKLPNLGGRIIR